MSKQNLLKTSAATEIQKDCLIATTLDMSPLGIDFRISAFNARILDGRFDNALKTIITLQRLGYKGVALTTTTDGLLNFGYDPSTPEARCIASLFLLAEQGGTIPVEAAVKSVEFAYREGGEPHV